MKYLCAVALPFTLLLTGAGESGKFDRAGELIIRFLLASFEYLYSILS